MTLRKRHRGRRSPARGLPSRAPSVASRRSASRWATAATLLRPAPPRPAAPVTRRGRGPGSGAGHLRQVRPHRDPNARVESGPHRGTARAWPWNRTRAGRFGPDQEARDRGWPPHILTRNRSVARNLRVAQGPWCATRQRDDQAVDGRGGPSDRRERRTGRGPCWRHARAPRGSVGDGLPSDGAASGGASCSDSDTRSTQHPFTRHREGKQHHLSASVRTPCGKRPGRLPRAAYRRYRPTPRTFNLRSRGGRRESGDAQDHPSRGARRVDARHRPRQSRTDVPRVPPPWR